LSIQQSDMPNVMSKMMLLGMSFPRRAAGVDGETPAKEIGRFPELGTLGVGRIADIAVLQEQSGVFAFKDAWPAKRFGTKRLECVLTVRAPSDYERPARPTSSPDTEVYDLLIKRGRLTSPESHREEEWTLP